MTNSIRTSIHGFLETIRLARSKNTFETYSFALQSFEAMLTRRKIDLNVSVSDMSEDAISWFATYLKEHAPATEQLYLQAVRNFYKYLSAERLADINLSRLDMLKQQRARRPGIRLPQFPADDIERILAFVNDPRTLPLSEDVNLKLREIRDRAFLLTLADTGLRVNEACKLCRGDVDWNEQRAIIIGKGNKQAVVRFTSRSLQAIKDYLSQRAILDGNSGKPLGSLPLFARHDKGAGKKIKPITTTTGRNIVRERVRQFLGSEMTGKITPHSFRHYFVTSVLQGTGNLALAQKLARHENIQVTQRYTHLSDEELDKAYYEVFENRAKQGKT